jgi:hypothetical protein
MNWLPRPIAVGEAIAATLRPLYSLYAYAPEIPNVMGLREKARQKVIETALILLLQGAVRCVI